MALPRLLRIRSDKDTHFTGALATNAMEIENFNLPGDVKRIRIVRVTLWADQNLDWDVYFFRSTGADDTDLDLDTAVDWVEFQPTAGEQIAGAGPFRYSSSGLALDIACVDEGRPNQITIGLVNRDATSKIAGATGEVVIEIEFEQ